MRDSLPSTKKISIRSVLNAILFRCRLIGLALSSRIRQCIVLSRIRSYDSNRKIRVLFLCSNVAKWKCQSVYTKMESSGVFEPIVVITALGEMGLRSDDELLNVFNEADAFFEKLGNRHVRACSLQPRRYGDLSILKPDVVFFPEPWEVRWPQTTREVSRFALPCYVPYFVVAHVITEKQCDTIMHRYLFAYFTQNKYLADIYEKAIPWLCRSYHTVPTGHPALDMLGASNSNGNTENVSEKIVIYAPHHSIAVYDHRHPDWRIGTFLETGKAILNYAKQHLDINWVFKPHPQLKRALREVGQWTEKEIDDYYLEWERIGSICTDGSYQELFLKSNAMITDCGSFLLEYGATGKPLIHLVPNGAGMGISPHIKDLLDAYYRVETNEGLMMTLDMVLSKGEDPKRPQRLAALRKTGLLGVDAAQNIVDYLRKELRR